MSQSVTIRYPSDSLGDIPAEDYADALDALIFDCFQIDCKRDIKPASVLRTDVYVTGDWGDGPEEFLDPTNSRVVAKIHDLCERAFKQCCRGEVA
jgi:hypothetical protein